MSKTRQREYCEPAKLFGKSRKCHHVDVGRVLRPAFVLLFVFLYLFSFVHAQSYYTSSPATTKRAERIQTDSGTLVVYCERASGKIFFVTEEFTPVYVRSIADYQPPKCVSASKKALITIHGNIQYDFTYRSLVDTPFSQRNLSQHTVQTTFDVMFRDKYPVKITMLSRQSNSPYFEDLADVSVQFGQKEFLQKIRENLMAQVPLTLGKAKLEEAERLYEQKRREAELLREWLTHPGRLQELVESREKEAVTKLRSAAVEITDSLLHLPVSVNEIPRDPKAVLKERVVSSAEGWFVKLRDSARKRSDTIRAAMEKGVDSLSQNDLLGRYRKKKEELDRLIKETTQYGEKIKSVKKDLQDSLALLKQKLARIKDPAELKKFIKENKLSSKDLPKGWQALSSINAIGLGRTWVDYSELTVQHISLTGINTELNPGKLYLAFAAGKVNYRFRDFVLKNNDNPKQQLWLIRAGMGKKDGNGLIFTWYDGKRNLLNNYSGAPATTSILERVMGLSIQGRYQVNDNNYIILESAKSSFHNTDTAGRSADELMKKIWHFKDRTNEAWSIKLYSYWPGSNTRINGYYRKMGEHFQSFNLQPANVNQESYHFKVQQLVWKKRIQIDASIRKNDFSNPLINPGISSKTVFKSFQASLRVPKYPFVSLGYFPSSQLTVLDNNIIAENQYNTFSAVASYAYRLKGISMSSNAVYMQFFNNSTDTGFIYYNASSITLNHYLFFKGVQIHAGYTLTKQRNLNVRTLDAACDFQPNAWLTIRGGVKVNHLDKGKTFWGGAGGVGIALNRFGTIQVNYDKTYLPGLSRNLLPVDMGRVTYYRIF